MPQAIRSYASLPVSQLRDDPDCPRHPGERFDAENTLVASVRALGVLDPLLVSAAGDSAYLVVDGGRRLRAAQALGLPAVPCQVRPPLSAGERAALRFRLHATVRPWGQAERRQAQRRLASLGVPAPAAA